MNVAGIDPSLTGSGVADVAGELSEHKSNPTSLAIYERHSRLTDLRERILADITGADLVVIEQPAYSKAVGHMHDRSGLWWLVAAAVIEAGMTLVEVPPTALKKFATGKGNATKPDMRMALFQRFGLDVRSDNKVDAWWCRALGLALVGEPIVDLPKANLTALDGIDVPKSVAA